MAKKKKEEIAVRVGAGGRIVIPKSVLVERGIEEGDIVLVSLKKAKVEAEENNHVSP